MYPFPRSYFDHLRAVKTSNSEFVLSVGAAFNFSLPIPGECSSAFTLPRSNICCATTSVRKLSVQIVRPRYCTCFTNGTVTQFSDYPAAEVYIQGIMMRSLLVLIVLPTWASAQMQQQCTCAQIEPCTHVNADTVLKCVDHCKKYAAEAGLTFEMAKQCFEQVRGPVDRMISCMKEDVLSTSCAKTNPIMIPKRYMETFKMAMFAEMNNVLSKSGIRNQLMAFMKTGKKFTSCTLNCGERATGECKKRHNCGLSLPSDNVLVQKLKQCMIKSGFGTSGLQQICSCLANAGARQLSPSVCSRLVIS